MSSVATMPFGFQAFGVYLASYWTFCILLSGFDYLLYTRFRASLWATWKIQPEVSVPRLSVWGMVALQVVVTQVLFALPLFWLLEPMPLTRSIVEQLSSSASDYYLDLFLAEDLMRFACLSWTQALSFYVLHRMFHLNWFGMMRFHRKHHEFHAPIAVADAYVSWEELVLVFVALAPATYLFRLTREWRFFFLILSNLQNALNHSGLTFLPTTRNHDKHHSRLNCNFATIPLIDYVFGTHL